MRQTRKDLNFILLIYKMKTVNLSKKNLLVYLKIILMIYKINQENSSLVRKF